VMLVLLLTAPCVAGGGLPCGHTSRKSHRPPAAVQTPTADAAARLAIDAISESGLASGLQRHDSDLRWCTVIHRRGETVDLTLDGRMNADAAQQALADTRWRRAGRLPVGVGRAWPSGRWMM
jgi:hypothetical protein